MLKLIETSLHDVQRALCHILLKVAKLVPELDLFFALKMGRSTGQPETVQLKMKWVKNSIKSVARLYIIGCRRGEEESRVML
jgi:hypothetical protein